MRYRSRLLAIIPALALLFYASCAPRETPPQDPTREQITLLQKQMLELQKIQNDAKTKLDEIDALTERLKTLEERQHIRRAAPPPEPAVESAPADTEKIAPEKKPIKKKAKKKKAKKKRAKTQKPITQQAQPQQPARTQ